MLLAAVSGSAQTFTSPTGGTFTNAALWNFGAGPVPVSDAALALGMQSFGGGLVVANDLNLTLQMLDFAGNGGFTVGGLLGGNFAFTGGAGLVNFGSSATVTLAVGVVMGSGLSSLTLDGGGPGLLAISGVISSNTSAGAPLVIATDAPNPVNGIVTLSGANTFSGGVVQNTGTLNLGHSRALGDRTNILTVNGGSLRTTSSLSVANDIALNSTLNFNGSANLAIPASLSLSGVLSGVGGVTHSGSGLGAVLQLRGTNTYTGATTLRGLDHGAVPQEYAASLHITGAAGSILQTSGIAISAGSTFRLDYSDGHSAANTRVSAATAISVAGGFLETLGNEGFVTQSLGTVTAGGLATIAAGTNGGGVPVAGSATEVTIANLIRTPGGTVTFTGPNLGGTAASALGPAQGNVILTQLNGGAPSAALMGGGGTSATNLSILPWALGDEANEGNRSEAGSGFVTYGAHGVRLLNAATEYYTPSTLDSLPDTFQNVRAANSIPDPTGPVSINSLFIETDGISIGGANTITVQSGALASNADATILAPLEFGAGGTGEAVISVIAPLGSPTPKTMTLSGTLTAGSLVKSGHGTLVLSGAGNTVASAITLNGGQLSIDAVAQLGGATALNFYSPSQSAVGATLLYTGGGAEILNAPITTTGGMAGFTTTLSSLDLAGNISGTGGVRKDGPETLVLSGTNTYSGGTYLAGGTLDFDSDVRLGAPGKFLHTSGGKLSVGGPWTTARPLTITSGVSLLLSKDANNVTFSGPIDGDGPLQLTGSGTVTVESAANGYNGEITFGSPGLAGGSLVLSGDGAMNAARFSFGPSIGVSILDFSTATAPSGTPWRSIGVLNTLAGAGSHVIQLGSSALTPVDLRVNSGTGFGKTTGVIQGFGKFIKTGNNPLTLDGLLPNTFTGNVEVWGGTLNFGNDTQLGNPANTVTLQGGTLGNTGTNTTTRAIALAVSPQPILRAGTAITLGNGLAATTGGATFTIAGAISGPGGFNKSGNGTVQFTTANNYAGDTQITGGILAFTDPNQLGSSSSRIRLGDGSGTLRLAALPVSSTDYTVNRTIIALGGSNTINVSTTTARLILAGSLVSGSSPLLLTGPGRFVVSGDNRSFFAPLAISSNGAANNLTLSGQLRRATIRIDGVDTSLVLSGGTRDVGGIPILDTGSTIALGTGGRLTSGFNNTSMAWKGNVSGNNALFLKTGTGAITLNANANSFSGGFHLLSGSGNTTTISDGGALPLQNALHLGAWGNSANAGPILALSNTGTNALDDGISTFGRLATAQIVHSHSGELQFFTNAGTVTTETTGSLRGAGMSTVTMATGGRLHFADATNGLTRVNRGTFLFRAGNPNMGTGTATTALANLTFGNLLGAALIGGGGAAGTTTINILPYAIGDITGVGAGSNFVTYGANGIRVLNTTNETRNNANSATLTGTTTENVRFANTLLTTTQLSGGTDRTINALNIAGTANRTRIESGTAEKLIVTSGTILSASANTYAVNAAGTAGLPLGIQVAELQTGTGNTQELNVFAVGDLSLGARVTTSGGLTKSGAGALYLTSTANTYTGATTVNAGSLVIDDLAALGGSTALQIGGGFLKYRGGDTTLTQSVIAAGGSTVASAVGLGASAGFHIVSGTTLSVAGANVSGNGGILKDGTGVLRLTGTSANSGATLVAAGTLAIGSAASLGTNARVVFTDSAISANGGQTLRFDAPMTLAQDFVVNSAQNGTGFGFDTNGNSVTLSGTLLDARNTSIRGLYKFGAGELNLTATEMYTGATQVFGGSLRLSGANGSILNSTGTGGFSNQATIVVNPGAALVLDNTAANNNNRLPDVWDTPFGTGNTGNGGIALNGGELRILGHAAGTNERINQIEFASATVTLSGGGTTLTSGQVIRGSTSGSSAILIRGTNLGALPGPTSTNWFVSDLGSGGVQLHGAGGAEGTPFINILRGGMGDTSATGSGTDLVTYSADVGFRTLSTGEYTSVIPANNFDLNRAPNIALTGAATVNQATAISALKLGPGASLGGPGTALLTQSTVLATGNASIDVPSLSTNIDAGGPATIFLTAGASTTLTVNSLLPGSAMGKYGDGTLLLNARRIGSGPTALKQGTLTLGAAGALNPLSALALDPGATFNLGGADRFVGSLLHDGATIGSFQMGQASAGTVAVGLNRLTIYDAASTVFSGNITGTGGLTKALSSTGTSTFNLPLNYTGSTILRGGVLQLAGAGTLASNLVEIRGGTLLFNNTDDNATSGYVAHRLGVSTPITLAGGGMTFTENANTPGNHSLGAMTLAGGGLFTITNGSTAPSTVTVANLTRATARGTLNVIATNLGLTRSPVGGARIFLTQIEGAAPGASLIGGGGAVGTTNQSILPWAFSTTAGSYLTYGADGLRPLAAGEYATDLNTAAATDNVRTSGEQLLSLPRTVNSLLVTSGNVGGAHDLTLTSGALTIPSGASIGVGTNALLTGVGNTRELVINGAGTLNYNITTSGGVTKFGTGTLNLGGSNPFTGGLNINEGRIVFTDDRQLGATAGALRFGGTSSTNGVLAYEGPDNIPLAFDRPVETTSLGYFLGQDSHRWQMNGVASGPGGLGYSGADSVFEINAAHTYSGPTHWLGGHVYFSGDSAFGSGGELVLAGGAAQNLVLRSDWMSSRLIHAAAASSIQTNGYEATWNGQLVGTSALFKNGTGRLTISEPIAWSGALAVNAGELRLRDRASLAGNGNSINVNAGAALSLDDTGVHASDRLNDITGSVNLNGGAFALLGGSVATTEEVINGLALGAGASTITLTPGAGQSAIIRLDGTVSNDPGAGSLWRGTNLGVNAPGTTNSANFLLTPTNTSTFPLTGGGAPAGHPSVSVIAGGFGDISATGLGTQLVTYDAAKGVRLLNPNTEFTTTLVNGSAVTDNVKADGTSFSLANATTINALWLKDGGSVTGAGELTLRSGNLLVTGSGNTVTKTLIAASGNALAIGGPGNVTFTSAITSATTGGLIKSGAGTLTLNSPNTYIGNTVLKDGILAVGDASAFDTTGLFIQGGEVRNVSGSPLTLANEITLNAPMKIGGVQDFEFSGNVTLNSATREIETTNTGTTTLSGVIQNSQSLINYGLTKTGTGRLVLSNANTFDGPTTVNNGTLEAAAVNALGSTNSVALNSGGTLLLNSSGNHINNAATFNLNGGTFDTGGTSEGAATTIGLGALTLTASSIIDFTGAAATLTFASGSYMGGVLSISNWSGSAYTAGTDGLNDRLIFAGDNTARLAFLSTFSPGSIAFSGFGSGYTALQFDANYFEVVPVPEPTSTLAALGLIGLAGWREGRRRRKVAPTSSPRT